MMAGDKTFSLDTSIVGSIGVIAPGFGAHELIKRFGIERRLFVAGSKKALRRAVKSVDTPGHGCLCNTNLLFAVTPCAAAQ